MRTDGRRGHDRSPRRHFLGRDPGQSFEWLSRYGTTAGTRTQDAPVAARLRGAGSARSRELCPHDLPLAGDDFQAPRRREGGDEQEATTVLLGEALGLWLRGPRARVDHIDPKRGVRE